MNYERRFGGIARLYGTQGLARFNAAHICVIGVGGVGSWVVEALARSGVGEITLIDLDNVAESNTNRQLPAIESCFGMAKVDALAQRVAQINSECKVHCIEDFVTEENISEYLAPPFDFVIDCIDQVRVKAAIAAWCVRHKRPIVVSGGAGGQMDPTLIQIKDLLEVTHDPLLSNMRYTLRKRHGFSRDSKKKFKIACVFSTESLTYPSEVCEITQTESAGVESVGDTASKTMQGLSCAGFGASMAVTASFAMALSAHVLKKISLMK